MAPADLSAGSGYLARQVDDLEDSLMDALLRLRYIKGLLADARQIVKAGLSPDDTAVIMQNSVLRESVYEREIVAILKESGRRLTFKPLLDQLQAHGIRCHEVTVKRYLKKLMRDGRIDNRHEGLEDPGYGLVNR